MTEQLQAALRLISLSEAAKRLNRGVSTLYLYLDPDSRYYKPDLPRPVRQGSSVGFLEHEIDEYILTLMEARDRAMPQSVE